MNEEKISPFHVDRRVDIVADLLHQWRHGGAPVGVYWPGQREHGKHTESHHGSLHSCSCWHEARDILAVLDADLADPDTENRMVRAIGRVRQVGLDVAETLRVALAAWRGDA